MNAAAPARAPVRACRSPTSSAQNPASVSHCLTIREVAERLRVCQATVYRMIDEGRLPAVRVSSRAIRVDAALLPRS
jgi:excisionase family DNA binding protein